MIKIITITVIFLFSGLLAIGQSTEENRKRSVKQSDEVVAPSPENKENRISVKKKRIDKTDEEILSEYREQIDKLKNSSETPDKERIKKMEERYEELEEKLKNR